LRQLQLTHFYGEDAVPAKALCGVSAMLESLELICWRHPGQGSVDQTISAIGTLHSLNLLTIQQCQGMTPAMLEPILIGAPPTEPPLCANIRTAYIELDQKCPQFVVRLRESIRQLFPDIGEYDVNGR
jgi:hypothetical protein